VGARVNGRLVRLGYELKSGDSVEILTSPNATPREEWLGLARTTRARGKIRHWLKEQRRADSISLGREMLERELKRRRKKMPPDEDLVEVAQSFGLEDIELLFARLGEGQVSAMHVANRIYPEAPPGPAPAAAVVDRLKELARPVPTGVKIQGISSLMIHLAQCCSPVPGDRIAGIVTRGRGVSVHRQDCPNTFADKVEPERLVEVTWDADRAATFLARITVHGADRPGMLGDISAAISKAGSNIKQAVVGTEESEAVGDFLLEVRNLHHLDRIKRAILATKGVKRVERRQLLPPGHREDA
jgi:GTP pyrophosphokinase